MTKPIDQLNKEDKQVLDSVVERSNKGLIDVIYCVDAICDEFVKGNRGEVNEWIRHLNNAYNNYKDSQED